MTLNELRAAILDELDTVASEPVVDLGEVREMVERLFKEYANAEEKDPKP